MANRYSQIITEIFIRHCKHDGCTNFEFDRDEITTIAEDLGIPLPKNLGDVIYSFRYRNTLPPEIARTAGIGKEWVIEGAGRARYRFSQKIISRIVPRNDLLDT